MVSSSCIDQDWWHCTISSHDIPFLFSKERDTLQSWLPFLAVKQQQQIEEVWKMDTDRYFCAVSSILRTRAFILRQLNCHWSIIFKNLTAESSCCQFFFEKRTSDIVQALSCKPHFATILCKVLWSNWTHRAVLSMLISYLYILELVELLRKHE